VTAPITQLPPANEHPESTIMPGPAKTDSLAATPRGDLPAETSAIMRIFGRNTLWLWIDLGALRIGTALAGLFLIRYFGPVNFGIYATALAVGWFANAVIDLGLTRYSARAVAATPEEVKPILALSLFTTIVSALPTIAVLLIALRLGRIEIACLAAGFVLCNMEGTASLCSSILTAHLRSRAILPGSLIGAGGLIAITCVVIWLHLSVLTMLVALCFKSLAVLLLRLWQLRSHWPGLSYWTWREYKRVTHDALMYFAYNLTQVGYGRAAILCLGLVATPDKVGLFAAGFTLSDVIPQWSYALSGALLPVWTRLFEEGRTQEMINLRQRVLDLIVFACVPIWISLALYAPQICALLGSRFADSAPVLRVVAYRCILTVLDGFLGHGFLVAVNRVKERQIALTRSLILLAALSLIFGHYRGALGVAYALLVSDAALILQYLLINSRIGLTVEWPSVVPTLTAGACMIACGLSLPSDANLVLKILAIVALYVSVLFVLSRNRLLSAGRTLRECAS
jgi:O-antigen/teichoic acid export membrane protein